MIDAKLLETDMQNVMQKLITRNQDFSYLANIDNLLQQRKEIIVTLEECRKNHNQSSKEMQSLLQQKKDDSILELQKKIIKNKEKISLLEENLLNLEAKINELLLTIPNIPHESVPIGNDEMDNVEIRQWKIPQIKDNLPHWEIAKKLNLIDFERAVKISGSRFIIYKGQGSQLVRALINFLLDHHIQNEYEEYIVPTIVKEKSLVTTGNLPKFKEDLFQLQEKDFYLIPTAEVPLTNLHQNEIIDGKLLPLNYCSYTACYRSEAGSAGKDTRGLIRLHQFNKVELVKIVKPENSYFELEKLTNSAETVLKLLGLPYRVIVLCTGDLGFSASKTYDIEVWMPSQNKYREISSCSNCEDFQARRGKIRFKDNLQDKTQLVHTLNGSGVAIDRLVAAILENNYIPEKNSVVIPKNLQKYMMGLKEIVKKP